MPILLFLLLVAVSVVVGWFGRNRAIGFAGFFVLSLLLTPFVMALVLLVSVPRTPSANRKSLKAPGEKDSQEA
ncbi:MAG: hypothetical protein B7Y62_10560 [Sphingomonadales bacterium 35-56-22]|jgi:Sec-independent protein secretion pathway component TatC|uniref:hypothetical protein n=1 Tax=Sphingorhabdus sp. TaxID=1902408 RepID=UPI000BD548BC|nr:hypothetical protein [Sphingorhabdus sp.]OYY14477.1 MAG: hypothetical protein B7Y62_10560 [Sphingomonadales bacterium 35-56-22]OYY96711.1 MAG: hypothetical protein B7Y38_10215 [Sphingomonadales bacterium 28-56-43]OYZ61430.1 MAG: hypothetical protein B7Y10_03135 [Sphingomonadales bacterium 24-56-14]OZA82646.1 MAG: hypothetical protein B7X66_06820 [Sphingomonadales bacterium 39-57-19]HQS13012.1 hypothetical protein [Sphingorhabdus sp.]